MIGLKYLKDNKEHLTLCEAVLNSVMKIIREIKTEEIKKYIEEKALECLNDFKLCGIDDYGDYEICWPLTDKQIDEYLELLFESIEEYDSYFFADDIWDDAEMFYNFMKEEVISVDNVLDINLSYIVCKYIEINDKSFNEIKNRIDYNQNEDGRDWYIDYNALDEDLDYGYLIDLEVQINSDIKNNYKQLGDE